MLLNIIILFLLLAGFFIGFRRGLILQLIHLAGFVIAYVVAFLYFKDFADTLKLWIPYPSSFSHNQMFSFLGHMDVETAFYRAIAFVLIFIAVKIVMNIIGSMLDFLAELPLIRTVNHSLGAAFGFVEIYLVLFILLYVGALAPINGLQTAIDHSSLAHMIINNTPVFSEKVKDMWLSYAQK